jgi:hypothetical protein
MDNSYFPDWRGRGKANFCFVIVVMLLAHPPALFALSFSRVIGELPLFGNLAVNSIYRPAYISDQQLKNTQL